MKKEIARNEFYEVYVDEEINRTYAVMKGKWNKVTDIPDFLEHTRESVRNLKPGFSDLVDIRTFEVPSPEVLDLIMESIKITESAGIGRQAQIINKQDIEIVRTSRDAAKETDMDVKMMQFDNYKDAIEWLDR